MLCAQPGWPLWTLLLVSTCMPIREKLWHGCWEPLRDTCLGNCVHASCKEAPREWAQAVPAGKEINGGWGLPVKLLKQVLLRNLHDIG